MHPLVGRLCRAASIGLGLVLMTNVSSASPSAKLVFARGSDTSACPDEAGFRSAVAARVGYDPFFPYAKRTVVTRIDAVAGGRFRARMEVLDDKGALLGEKVFVSSQRDCEELVRTLALAVSLAIDVADPPDPEPSPEPVVEPGTSAPEAPPAPAEPPPVERAQEKPLTPSRAFGEAWLTARGSVGLAKSPSFGVALGAAFRRRPWSIGVEGRYDPLASGDVGPARIALGVLAGSLVPCASFRWLFGCVVGTAGRITAESSGIRNPSTDSALFVAVGARVGAEVEIATSLALRAAFDVSAVPLAHRVRIGADDVYETSALFGSFGASAVARF